MTGPERKRNELKLDFDLEKNAIKNKVGNLTRLKKISLSFHLSLVITLLHIYKCHVFYIKSYILTLDHRQKFEWTDIFSSQCLDSN